MKKTPVQSRRDPGTSNLCFPYPVENQPYPVQRVRSGIPQSRALAELKALFVVKDLDGNSAYVERQAIEPTDVRATGAKRLEIMFNDGECLFALAPTYDETRPFFFVLPADPNRAAIASVRTLRP